MSTSTIKFYKVEFREEQNAFVDSLEDYLASIINVLTIEDFQYLRHQLEVDIKIPLSQNNVDSFIYNYCKITINLNDIAYYYIRDVQQVSESVLKISLHQDVINTLGQGNVVNNPYNPKNFNKRTLIKRQHMDRFNYVLNPTFPLTLTRNIDNIAEDINPIVWNKTKDEIINDTSLKSEDGKSWNIIYTASEDNDSIEVNLCYDDAINVSSPNFTAEINKSGLCYDGIQYLVWDLFYNAINAVDLRSPSNTICRVRNDRTGLVMKFCYGSTIEYNGGIFTPEMILKNSPLYSFTPIPSPRDITFYKNEVWFIGEYVKNSITISNYLLKVSDKLEIIGETYDGHGHLFKETGSESYIMNAKHRITSDIQIYTAFNQTSSEKTAGNKVYYSDYGPLTIANITNWSIKSLAETIYGEPNTLYAIDEVNTTNKKITKIISLPYCPIDIRYDEDTNTYILLTSDYEYIDDDTKVNNHLLHYLPESTPVFRRSNFTSINLSDKLTLTLNSRPSGAGYARDDTESKLYSSQYIQCNLNFDSIDKLLKLERLNNINGTTLNLDYIVSNSLSPAFLIGLNYSNIGEYKEEQNYDNIIKFNAYELPLLTSAYADYIATGFNYDLKSNELNMKQTKQDAIANILTSTVNQGVQGAISKNQKTAFVSAGLGTLSGIVNAAININQMEENQALALGSKLNQLSYQGVSVNGINEFDLFKYYSGNKLHYIEYEPNETFKDMMNEYLKKYGYNRGYYSTPNTTSRLWYNYIQCIPSIEYDAIKKAKKDIYDEFINKYEDGVTVYHKGTIGGQIAYDFEQLRENWETWILQ